MQRVVMLAVAAAAIAMQSVAAQQQQQKQRTGGLMSSNVSSLNATAAQASSNKSTFTVSQLLQTTGDAKVAPGMLAVAAVVAGLAMCTAGYRLFRASVFVCGFVGGGLAAARVVENAFSSESYVVAASWIAFAVGGLVVGGIAMSLHYAGIFAVGAACGVLLAVALSAGVGHKLDASHPNTVLLTLASILGLAGGVLAVCLEKPALVVLTSFLGAGLAVWGIGYFAGDFPSGTTLERFRNDGDDMPWLRAVPGAWWGYLTALVALTALGVVLQRHVTSRDGLYDAHSGFIKQTAALRARLRYERNGGGGCYHHTQTPSPRRQRSRRARTRITYRSRFESNFIV